jgi:hypothetical protein
MKYVITRTSNYSEEEDPKVEGAVKETLPYHYNELDRTIFGKRQYMPARDVMRECWTIELNSLEELHDLISKYGEIVVFGLDKEGRGFKLPTIEIYDNYRE